MMRLGLLADIHGDVNQLAKAIERLRRESVDTFVLLGDVIYDSRHADEIVELLRSCGAIGVWGNHELGLCVDPDVEMRQWYSESVMEFFSTLQPRLELEDVLVSHTFPTEDARDVLSFYVGVPEESDVIENCFARLPQRIMISGHFHRWFAATPSGKLDWKGEGPLDLASEDRYFIVVNAVMNGFAAVLDLERNLLVPMELS
ncbi:Calcineurin-like phosphoesterase superfamily domain protein [Stieleria neptunia]|uniref:Calcineurin-like phosphoesterase superfamily domain protein n=1 Tax=Stieleria neptunia TaxID=2527979 RepID=A0A518HWR4_9BACT|nr:metallophosphoesterase [Stieleria neptunia]QDV45300.1 Calcineurin-like phosphoesterase superfamily domain protein [Stieleria neptunia]